MDQKPFDKYQQQQQQQSANRPRIRIRQILVIAVVLIFGYSIFGNGRPPSGQDVSSPVYRHTYPVAKYWPGWPDIKHIVFFGDSYTSTRFLPKNGNPTEQNPFGNPPFPGPVSHKRPLWSDYLVGTYNTSLITAINLSWGGATVDDELIVPFIDVIEGLNRQVANNFLPSYSQKVFFPWDSHNTLFVFWFGINDVNGAWLWENRTEVWKRDLETYAKNIDIVYQSTAKNFLFVNVPPIHRAPNSLILKEELQQRKLQDVLHWNNEVANIVQNFTKTYNDVTAFWWDAFESYSEVLDDPCSHKETCSLKDLTTACPEYARLLNLEVLRDWEQSEPQCPYALKEYFWMDELHHGYHMHDVTAQGVIKMMSAMPKNYYAN